ncbi:hypothetical protein J4433_02590 [Candidatus Pacearchaeota archaeon]|nr:hypothetical protein [Candidatus Pacearchaeota archaeon]
MATGGVETSDIVKQFGGNITLINFELVPMQAVVVKKIVGNYVKRLRGIADYRELKIRLKKHEHGKSILYELDAKAEIITGREIILTANISNYNLYSALSEVLEKIIAEAMHKVEQQKKE